MRFSPRLPWLALGLGLLVPYAAQAQTTAAPDGPAANTLATGVPAAAAPAGASDPVVASVDGHPILLSEIGKAVQALPESERALPFDKIYPAVLQRMIDHQTLVMVARRNNLDLAPQVQQAIQAATNEILEGAYLVRQAVPQVTEAAIKARYDQLYAHRPVTEEVHARHILVATEAQARAIIEDLKKGADFAITAQVASQDADGQNGGDLGFFRRDQVWPALADAAFSLQPGQVGPDPIKNEFGWHVIKVEERRQVAPPSYPEAHDDIRKTLLADAVARAIRQARGQVIIRKYNLDGTLLATGPSGDAAAATLVHQPQ